MKERENDMWKLPDPDLEEEIEELKKQIQEETDPLTKAKLQERLDDLLEEFYDQLFISKYGIYAYHGVSEKDFL